MSLATRNAVWAALPLLCYDDERPPQLPHLDAATEAEVIARLLSPGFDDWSQATADAAPATTPAPAAYTAAPRAAWTSTPTTTV